MSNITRNEIDLKKRIPHVESNEMGIINKNINLFITRVHVIISKLVNVLKGLYSSIEELTERIHQIIAANEEMLASMNSIKNTGMKLDDNIISSMEAINEITNATNSINQSIKHNSDFVYRTSSLIRQLIGSIAIITGKSIEVSGIIKSLVLEGEQGYQNMQETVSSARRIEKSTGQITELLNFLSDIVEKTNILSINTAIQAARASKAGKSFSIIAFEIKDLAITAEEQVKSVQSNLGKIVSDIKNTLILTEKSAVSFKNIINGISNISRIMEANVRQLKEMEKGTTKVEGEISALITHTESVNELSENIKTKTRIIDGSMQGIKDLSGQNKLSLNEMLIGFQDIKKGIDSILDLGELNNQMVNVLKQETDKFLIIDTSHLNSTDGQPLVQWNIQKKEIPARPENPLDFPEDDERHWYDMEFAGWHVDKINIPESPFTGARGKKVICMYPGFHPYYKAFIKGLIQIADLFEVKLEILEGDWSIEKESEHVDYIIEKKADFVIMSILDIDSCVGLFQKLNNVNIPIVACTSCPSSKGFKYIIGFTGFDDWGSHRVLAGKIAKDMNKQGNYCILGGHPQGAPQYYSRIFAVLTELKKIAPEMKCLDYDTADFSRDKAKAIVNKWLARFNDKLQTIMVCDSPLPLQGVFDSFDENGINDVKVYVTGNNKISLDLMKAGKIEAIRWESAESDGALAINMAIDWFNGLDFLPIQYLPPYIITKDRVDEYYPPQW